MINPEVLNHLPEITEFIGFLTIACFSVAQRKWILERDNNKCQFPESHDCDKEHLQAHHITPQHYAQAVFPKLNYDVSTNGITLCKNAHVGKDGVHPDTFQALEEYRGGDKSAFAKMAKERQEKLKGRQIYWRDKWDRIFHAKALLNDQLYTARGNKWPERRKNGRDTTNSNNRT